MANALLARDPYNGEYLLYKLQALDGLGTLTPDISLYLFPKLLNRLNFWQTNGYLRDIGSLESLSKALSDISHINF